jgi:uncharacterized protein HemX
LNPGSGLADINPGGRSAGCGETMVVWAIILACALGGGVVLLHGFAKSKSASEQMLKTYQQLLQDAAERDKGARNGQTGSSSEKPES